jgi:hypothetical protein
VVRGARTRVDRRPYAAPGAEPGLIPRQSRDFGTGRSLLSPYAAWRSHVGVVAGGGPVWTRYGYRTHPYAARHSLRLALAPLHGRMELAYRGELRRENSPRWLELGATASDLARSRFSGYGNALGDGAAGESLAWLTQVDAWAAWHLPLSDALELSFGPVARYTDAQVREGTPLAALSPRIARGFGQAGARGGMVLDTRDDPLFPRTGVRAEVSASGYPAVWDAAEGFGSVEASASTYLRLGAPVLAVRAGGRRSWGGYPFHQAAFLGGSGTLRGHAHDRFSGDAAVFGGAELRVPLLPMELVVRGRLGVSLLADAGRVIHDGHSPGGWHTAAGAGLWFATPPAVLTLHVARGEDTRVYAGFGMPF